MAALAAGALTATGLAGSAQAADINVAKNAGFESGLANWSCTDNSGTTVSSPVHGGTAALKATPSGQDTARCTQTVAVKPDSTYTLPASNWRAASTRPRSASVCPPPPAVRAAAMSRPRS
ncbi:carbohydrate binding domain-containing protein [Streptomyces sp. NPDC001880]